MKLIEITNTQYIEIEEKLHVYKIENYTIRPDGSVDVDGSVDISFGEFTEFPIKFGRVNGDFECTKCVYLTSLVGAPSYVGGDFICGHCYSLTSLVGAPSEVGDSFDCIYCPKLTSLEWAPLHVGKNFDCRCCSQLTSLIGHPATMTRGFFCDRENITTGGISLMLTGCVSIFGPAGPFKIIAKYLGRPDDIFDCQMELIDAGYEAYAEL